MTLPAEIANSLKVCKESIELCDEEGTTLGHFEPSVESGRPPYPWPFTDAEMTEIDLTANSTRAGRTLDDILADAGIV